MIRVADDPLAQSAVDQPAECPICGTTTTSFLPFGVRKSLADRQCPTCGSLERHRQIWLYFRNKTNLFTDRLWMLHIAPEKCMRSRLRARKNLHYLSADIASPGAMVRMDITDIRFPADSFDVIYASHVLEHVPDDQQAMRELHRVLRPGGWAVLQVPIVRDTTEEDPTVTDPTERERRFGQADHVRVYGRDGEYERRLRAAGFDVRVEPYFHELGPENAQRYRLVKSEDIYFCMKPGPPATRHRLATLLRELEHRARRRVRLLLRRASRLAADMRRNGRVCTTVDPLDTV
jgi:SAM-dependent methyltransferase